MTPEIKDDKSIKQKAKELVLQMTLEEKIGLCSGKDCWSLKSIERLNLESISMMDGPHGLRKQIGVTDNLGIGESVPSVCFPTASAIACSFDCDLVYNVGKAIGEECNQEGVSVILGPGVNMKRSPLCGRNFEYYSEDPVLSGKLAASMIKGVQSTGTGTSLKHFAVNNQEKNRMTINAVVDERALREIYLKAFEIAIKESNPYMVMCSYNKLNSKYCSENEYLLKEILRKEWGFNGAVVSDWGAVHDRTLGIKAGLDIEMPGNNGFNDAKIIKSVKSGFLSEYELNKTACRVTELILKCMLNKKDDFHYDYIMHHELAVKAAQQSIVLLKNDNDILPAKTNQKVAVIGEFAKKIRFQGAGSSKINPIKIENPWDALINKNIDVTYASGYSLKLAKQEKNILSRKDILINEACEVARDKDIVFIFAGLPEGYESEGFDRSNMRLPDEQNELIEKVSNCNSNVVVILVGGAPIELPWINDIKGLFLAYLGGEGVGKAIVNLLFGDEVPCGKLAETWPIHLKDTPCYNYFPGGRLTSEYRESIYIGYRYYEKAEKEVLFTFGFGLSYVKFKYSDLKLNNNIYSLGESIKIDFNITNCGSMSAREIAFIFVSHKSCKVFLHKKELKDFTKIYLNANETKNVSIKLDINSLCYYNTLIKDWDVENGEYKIMICSSSKDCLLEKSIYINSNNKAQPDLAKKVPIYYNLAKNDFKVDNKSFEALYGKTLPISDSKPTRPYTLNNTLVDIRHTFIGKFINIYADKIIKKIAKSEQGQEGMMSATIKEMPFFALVSSGEDIISESMMNGIIDMLNGHYIKGLKQIFK